MAFEFVVIIFVMADDVFLIILDDKLERKIGNKIVVPGDEWQTASDTYLNER